MALANVRQDRTMHSYMDHTQMHFSPFDLLEFDGSTINCIRKES